MAKFVDAELAIETRKTLNTNLKLHYERHYQREEPLVHIFMKIK